uniref:FXYD domain-containing ion transport regulator n=1 Tax=Propithecus coquereli TaxID=379532 RepID=A0A2K6FYX3_PROCO
MQEAALSLFFLLAGLPALDANDPEDKNSPFYYGAQDLFVRGGWMRRTQAGIEVPSAFPLDWHSLQIGGLICAVVLSTIGIVVVMSGKCKCKFRQKPSRQSGDAPPLITPGSAHNC